MKGDVGYGNQHGDAVQYSIESIRVGGRTENAKSVGILQTNAERIRGH